MRQSVGVPSLSGLPRGYGSRLPDLVSEAIGCASVPEGVSISYGGFEPQTCRMYFDVSGPGGVSYSVLSQVTDTVASRVALDRPSRPSGEPQAVRRIAHLSLIQGL